METATSTEATELQIVEATNKSTEATELQTIEAANKSTSNRIHPVSVNDENTPSLTSENVPEQQKDHVEAFVQSDSFTATSCQDSATVIGGKDNPMFILNEETKSMECVTPPLTYVDFMPQLLLKAESKDEAPQFSRFSTLVEKANQWLQENTDFTVWKCETVMFKLEMNNTFNKESVLYMESAYGVTKFLVGLRLWLLPQTSDSIPVAQIGYTTAIPSRQSSDDLDGEISMNNKLEVSTRTKLSDMITILNKQFMKKPLPGVILNVENVLYRISHDLTESPKVDPDNTCWAENGSKQRTMVHGVRVFYLKGNSDFGKIGFHDELPDIYPSVGISVKYGPFKNVVQRMGVWLKEQKNIRVVNLQSVSIKNQNDNRGIVKLESDLSGNVESALTENRYSNILRVFYVTTSKSDNKPYESVDLSTRLFVPVRISGKNFESFTKTMQRIMKWMNYTKVPPFGVETVQYQIYTGGDGNPVQEQRVDSIVRRSVGRHHLSTVRLYFPSDFEEPPPEITPEVSTSYATSWGCSIS